MKADKIVKGAVKKIHKAVSADLSHKELEKIQAIVSDMAIELVNHTTEGCSKSMAKLYGPKTDLAHQISDGIKRKQSALITNLQSMR